MIKLVRISWRDDSLKNFNPDKLYVEYKDGVTEYKPVNNRKYTLTHSDQTAELFLTIGLEYDYDKFGNLRDEVLAEWRADDYYPFLYVYVYINGQSGSEPDMRNEIFRRELPLALQAILYGDRTLLDNYPDLKNSPVWVYFDSENPYLNKFENWGVITNYIK